MSCHNSKMLLLPEEKVTDYKNAVTHGGQEMSSNAAALPKMPHRL